MLGWLKRGGKTPGWLAVSLDEAGLAFAQAHRAPGGTARVSSYGFGPSRRFGRQRASTMLRPGEYDMVMVEAPNVPRAEMKSALRWKVKDRIDYPIDEATLDYLDIPLEEGRSAQMYAIVARNEVIRSRIDELGRAGIALEVIEVPETAQRNIAALYEDPDRGAALVHFGRDHGLLTITHRRELYLSRRLDVGVEALAGAGEADEGPLEHVALEIQRTFDHFERQFRHVAVGKLLVAPTGHTTGLRALLQERFEMPVQAIDLTEALAFDGPPPDEHAQWRLFHHFGAALREEPA